MLQRALGHRAQFEMVVRGEALSEEDARAAFSAILQGAFSELELAAFVTAIKVRGETAEEIAGAAAAMRELMIEVNAPRGAIDIVGTGGDAIGTFNISTAAALVVAGAGVPVAKHGNRAASSRSGAADVLEKLGVNLNSSPEALSRCFEEAGLAFLWAPNHHPAMKLAAPVRQALKIRTIFNLLGPLCNPARTQRQLIGTCEERWLVPMAKAMARLGAEHVWIVHGSDGMDELTTTGPTKVVELCGGQITAFEIEPAEAGLSTAALADLRGGDVEENARHLRALLEGKRGPYRDIVLLNASAALLIAGKVETLEEGVMLAAKSIDEGHALKALLALIEASHAEG